MSDGYVKVFDGAFCEVWLHKSVAKAVRDAPAADRARAHDILRRLSEDGPEQFHDEQFKFEKRVTVGHKKVAVYAVKAFQVRILGGWVEPPPKRFVCPEGVIKKKPVADQDQLERVARKVGDYDGR